MLQKFPYFLFIFVRFKNDDNWTIDVRTFEFCCNLHYIDSIRTWVVWRNRIWKSRVRFLFAEKLKKLIFLCSKNFWKMFIAYSNCVICNIRLFSCCFVTLNFIFRFYHFRSFCSNRVIVEKGNGKTISSLPTWEKGNWKQKFPFPHEGRGIGKKLFSSYTKCAILLVFHRWKFIFFHAKREIEKNLFAFHMRDEKLKWKNFPSYMGEGKLKKISSLSMRNVESRISSLSSAVTLCSNIEIT